MFSVPLNPKLNEFQFNAFFEFLKKNRSLIYDVYFTSRIAPFSQDAMGDVFKDYQWSSLIDNALVIQNELGIPLSATFNNIHVSPNDSNLDEFIKNYKVLYDKGIRSATIPHALWLMTGRIQKAFPKLLIKNTILRNVQRANEVVKLVEAGYHYINIDRDLMRDKETLLRIKDAKEYCKEEFGVDVKIALLANEDCWGNCPVQDEHFSYNLKREGATEPTYFETPISKFSCPKWESEDPSYVFKIANLPPWREDWDKFLENLGIDIFKMHGRESIGRLFETMSVIEKYANGYEILWEEFENYLTNTEIDFALIDVWRETIWSCKFDCWDCGLCDKIVLKKSKDNLIGYVEKALSKTLKDKSKLTEHTLGIQGLTSNKVKSFINNVCELPECRYLEVGVYQGATFSAAIDGNNIYAVALDNWEQPDLKPMREVKKWDTKDIDIKTQFYENIRKVSFNSDIEIFDEDIEKFDIDKIKQKINVLFYDGNHTYDDHYGVLNKFLPILDNVFIYIVDDWNWLQVKDGTFKSIADSKLKVLYEKEISTSGEDFNDYWNGLGIFILKK